MLFKKFHSRNIHKKVMQQLENSDKVNKEVFCTLLLFSIFYPSPLFVDKRKDNNLRVQMYQIVPFLIYLFKFRSINGLIWLNILYTEFIIHN